MPLLAATATTALAFMPIAVGEGPSNEYVGGMAKTLIMAVTSSLFLSLTVVLPTLHYLEKMPIFSSDYFNQGFSSKKLYEYYRSALFWALSKPRRAFLVSFSMPLLGLLLFSTLDRDFFPANDRNMFQVRVELPNNSSVNATIEKSKILESNYLNMILLRMIFGLLVENFQEFLEMLLEEIVSWEAIMKQTQFILLLVIGRWKII